MKHLGLSLFTKKNLLVEKTGGSQPCYTNLICKRWFAIQILKLPTHFFFTWLVPLAGTIPYRLIQASSPSSSVEHFCFSSRGLHGELEHHQSRRSNFTFTYRDGSLPVTMLILCQVPLVVKKWQDKWQELIWIRVRGQITVCYYFTELCLYILIIKEGCIA